MARAKHINGFSQGTKKPSAIFLADYSRSGASDPNKSRENRWLNDAAQKRTAAAGPGATLYAVAADADGRNPMREYFGAELLRHIAGQEILRSVSGRESIGVALNDFNAVRCAPDCLQGLCGFSVRMDWRYTWKYQGSNSDTVKSKVLDACTKNGLPLPTQIVETARGLQAVWYLKQRKEANFLPVWNALQNGLCEIFAPFGAASARLGVSEMVELPVNGLRMLHSKVQLTSWDAMYNALRKAYYARAFSAIAARYFPDGNRPAWYLVQQMVNDGTLKVSAKEMPVPFIPNIPSYYWLKSAGFDGESIVEAAVPEKPKSHGLHGRTADNPTLENELRTYYKEVADDLLTVAVLRKGDFSPEEQRRLMFYVYLYTRCHIADKHKSHAPGAEAVRKANALMRHPMPEDALERFISGLEVGTHPDRKSAGRARVMSDMQITAKEEKHLKRLISADEKNRRSNKSGKLKHERDTELNKSIVEMLEQELTQQEIADKLGMTREAVNRRIHRNDLVLRAWEARKKLDTEKSAAKKAEKEKKRAEKAEKKNKDKDGGVGDSGTSSTGRSSARKKKTGRKPVSEARRLAILAVQRVRRAKERLARKCETCIRNLDKQSYTVRSAAVEWVSAPANRQIFRHSAALPIIS